MLAFPLLVGNLYYKEELEYTRREFDMAKSGLQAKTQAQVDRLLKIQAIKTRTGFNVKLKVQTMVRPMNVMYVIECKSWRCPSHKSL